MADVSKIKLPNGTTYNIKDTTSGYTTNTGTITKIQTTAGAHTAINVSSGAAAFNVPTKTSHLTNDSGFITSPNIPYLTCATAAGTVAKTTTLVSGTLPGTLTTGTQVAVKFTNSNTASNPTITIGSYGAISIKRYGTTAPSTSAATSWNAGNIIMLVYDGTNWLMADWTSPNTTYSEISEANITNATGSTTGLVSGRRAKAAVNAFESITDVTVNGTSVVANRVAAITVPTKTSDLTNDSGFITSHLVGNGAIDVSNNQISLKVGTKSVSAIVKSTVDGISGLGLVLSDDSVDGESLFIPDGNGFYAGSQAIINQIPTKTSDLTNDSGFITTDTNTTYALSGALSSHKFTSTLTAGGSGSGTSTSDFTLAAGTGITITDDASARKMTIACSVTNTDTKVSTAAVTSGTTYYPTLGSDTTSAATKYYDNSGISYQATNGTAGNLSNGTAILTLGNNLRYSTAGWKKGAIILYNRNGAYTTMVAGYPYTHNEVRLPSGSGTLALTDDIPSVSILHVAEDSENSGTYRCTSTREEIGDALNMMMIQDANLVKVTILNNDGTSYTLNATNYEDITVPVEGSSDTATYSILWFTGVVKNKDGAEVITKSILCGLYFDDYFNPQFQEGDLIFQISTIDKAYTRDGSTSLAKSTTLSQIGTPLILTPGTWMLVGTVEFPGKSDSTYRGISWHSSSGNILASMVSQPAINSTLSTRLQTTLLTTITETSSYVLYGAQNSSSSLTVDWYYRYVKLD